MSSRAGAGGDDRRGADGQQRPLPSWPPSDVEIAPSAISPRALNATADAYGVQRRYTDYRAMVEEVAPQGSPPSGSPT